MEWAKRIGARGGSAGGWRDDFPLSRELPEQLSIDLSALKPPVHPMFLVRLRVFAEWHAAQGRSIEVVAPGGDNTARAVMAMGIGAGSERLVSDRPLPDAEPGRAVVRITQLHDYSAIEDVAGATRELLEYQLTDVARLGEAVHMAVSELCSNAIEHGKHDLGAFIAVERTAAPRRTVSIAIADLGIGIPEHLRQRYPEWGDDTFAIGRAMEPGISGTGHPHRGNGFSETLEAALAPALSAARMDVHSANGFLRIEVAQERKQLIPFPSATYRRGTWISYDVVSV